MNTEPTDDDTAAGSLSSPPVVEDPLTAHRRMTIGAPLNPDDDPVAQYRAAMRSVRGY
jgi:hypothetical protein